MTQPGGLGLQDVVIEPEACAPGLKSIQPGLDAVEGLGALTATAGTTSTVEILASGEGIATGVEDLGSAAARCPRATLTAPDLVPRRSPSPPWTSLCSVTRRPAVTGAADPTAFAALLQHAFEQQADALD